MLRHPPEGGQGCQVEVEEEDKREHGGEEGVESHAVHLVVGGVAAQPRLVGEAVLVLNLPSRESVLCILCTYVQ